MFLEIGLFLALVVGLIYLSFKRTFQYFKNRNIPYIESVSFPFGNFGSNLLGKESLATLTRDFYKNYKKHPAVGIFQFNEANLLINHPELIKQCLVRDFSSFVDRGFPTNDEIDPLNGHLFFSTGAKWRMLRSKLSPTFTSGKIKQMFSIIEKRSSHLVTYLEQFDGKEIEMKEFLARLLTDIISECAFGVESNCIENSKSEFREWGKKAFTVDMKGVLVTFLATISPKIRDYFQIKTLDPKMTEFFINLVRDTMKYREENNIQINDFMHFLIQLKNNERIKDDDDVSESKNNQLDGKGLTIEECAAQAFVFFLAGFETSSTTMSNALYELAKNPEIQKQTQENIDQVFEKYNGKFTYESMAELGYLDNVINETLRKHPPAPFLNRQVIKPVDIKWGDENRLVRLEKHLKIIIPVYGLHYDPEYFPDPERFDPERFNEVNTSRRHKYVFLPFGEGPRNCIGARFGFLQTKLGLALLLRNFNFHFTANTPQNFTYQAYSIVLATNEVLKLKIERRFKE
uniref:Cytochrome P450 6NP1 n=1 Tax=Forficula auricularia TaxID=13068 RepID=A0A5P8N894_FORAU|nr:cytochrome P450 6NP1 [Forficula auricularia]